MRLRQHIILHNLFLMSSYDSEDNAKVEEDMEFEDKSWKHVKKYDGNRHGCICLVELDENGEEYTVDKVMMV